MSATLDLAKHLIACNATIVLDDSIPTVSFLKSAKKLFNTQNIRLKAKLDAYLWNTLQLQPILSEHLKHPYYFFLSVTAHQWQALLQMLGGIYCLDAVKKRIRTEERQSLTFLSDKLYTFVLKQGNFYAPILKTIVSIESDSDNWMQSVQRSGRFLLEYLWTQQPVPLVQRFSLIMPPGYSWNFRHVIDAVNQRQLYNICKYLLKMIER